MRKFLAYFFTFVAGAVIVGGGSYYLVNKKAADEREVLQGDNNTLRLQINDLQAAQTPQPTAAPTASDNDQVVAIIKAQCAADPKVDISKGTFNVKKLTAPFASMSYSCTGSGGGAFVIFKKVGDTWTIIYQGQQTPPPKDTIDKYGIPKDFQS